MKGPKFIWRGWRLWVRQDQPDRAIPENTNGERLAGLVYDLLLIAFVAFAVVPACAWCLLGMLTWFAR